MAIQTTIPGTDRDETLNNRGRLVKDEVLLDAAGGNDTVDNEGNLSSIMGGDGDDSINNKGNYVSIRGGTGDDTVLNSGNNVSYFYDLGDGNDTIYGFNPSDKVLVFGSRLYPSSWTLKSSEDGKDNLVIGKGRTKTGTFTGTMTYKDLNGGALHLAGIPGLEGSRKEIFNHINGSTITGGFGDDTVNNYADNILFCHNNGDGDDIIHGFNATSTLKIGDGTASYSAQKSDDDIIVNVYYSKPTSDNARADYKITLTGAASLSTVNIIGDNLDTTPADNSSVGSFTEGNDTCNNTVDGMKLLALGGDDKITNSGANVYIDGMGGNDTIFNGDYKNSSLGSNVSISGGDGNDSISNDGSNVTIDGGDGDDTVNSYEDSVTIDGGGGNDKIFTQFGDSLSIDGGDGNDTINNWGGTNVTIDGGAGDDLIKNGNPYSSDGGGSNASINGGAGNDTIFIVTDTENNLIEYTPGDGNDLIAGFNATSTLKIGGGSGTYSTTKSGDNLFVCVGNDTITLVGAATLSTVNIQGNLRTYTPVTSASKNIALTENVDVYVNSIEGAMIQALGGDDNLLNTFTGVSIDAGAGNDSVTNFNDSVTLSGGDGKDSIISSGASVSIDGGADDDFILNAWTHQKGIMRPPITNILSLLINNKGEDGGSNLTITGGAGNDTIYNYGENSIIDGGDGSDSIYGGTNSTITGGDGNDSIYGRSNSIIDGGDGDDRLSGGDNSTITGGDGNDTIYGRSNSIIDGGDGDDRLSSDSNSTIIGGAGDDSIYSDRDDSVTIDAGDGDDTIDNYSGTNVTIDAGDGKDSIYNSGDNVSIDGGEGNDKIKNSGTNVTIDAGKGNDSVYNSGDSVSIDAGDGDDTIDNSDTNVTIDGGEGNDKISLGSDYVSSALNNVIVYNEGDGNDTVWGFNDDDTISISAASYTSVKSNGNIRIWVGEGSVLLVGAESLDTVNIILDTTPADSSVDNFTEGNDTCNNTVDSVALLALGGDDSVTNSGASVTIDGMGGNDYVYNNHGASVSINGGEGNDTIRNDYGTNMTIDGGEGDDSIDNNSGTNVSINGGEGDDTIESSGTNVSINGGTGNDSIKSGGTNVSISGGEGNDTIWVDKFYSWNAETGKYDIDNLLPPENVTVDGGDGDDSIENEDGTNVSIDGGAGDDDIYNSGTNVSINGGTGNDTIQVYTGYSWNKETQEYDIELPTPENVTVDGGEDNDTIVNYDGTKVSIDGGEGDDDIWNAGSNVSINGGEGDDKIQVYAGYSWNPETEEYDIEMPAPENVTVSGGDGNDTIDSYGTNVSIDGGEGNDTIKNSGTNVTINGGTGDDSIKNGGTNVSINAGDGNDTIDVVKFYSWNEETEAYDIDNLSPPENVTVSGGDGNDQISLTGDAKKTLIEYTTGDGKDTVYGFDGDDTLKIGNGTTDTYSKATVDNDIIVTVGDGSILLVGAATLDNVNISGEDESSAADNWTLTDGVAKYKNLFMLSGINPNLTVDELDAVINVDGNKVILSADALGKSNVTLTTTGDYTLALGDDCPTVTATEKSWTLDGTTATYHDAGKSDGYKLTNSKTVTYTAATVGKALLTVSGVVEGVSEEDLNENLTVSGKALTVTPDVVGENFSVGAGYKVVFDEGDYGGSKFTGTTSRDTIEVNGNGLQIDGGKGNDTITSNGEGGNTYLFNANGGKDVVVGYGDDDTVKITDGSSVTASVKGKDIIVKAGKATMTLKNAATGTHLNIVDADDETLIDQTFYADRTVADGEVKLLSTFNSTSFTATDEIPNVDGSAVSRKFSLTGGDEDNTLIGGKGANFINGGGGSNELTGGKGNDTFVAGNGTDTITDYGVGTDKISLAADVTGFEVDGSDVILNFDDDKSMTIANGAGKKINFVRNGRTTPEIFMTGGKLSSNSKSITLASGTGSFDAGTVTTLVTIDGGLTENVFITGNAQSNKIFGGDGSDTLDGGAKNDTLTGGDGNDIFIYESGKDVIADYVSGKDKISLAAAPTSESLNSKGDVVLKFSSANQLTIKGGDEILFVTDGGEVTKTYLNDRIVGDDGVTLQSNFKATEFTLEELPKVDASATSAKVTLNGNDSDNVLIGGKGANLIDGNAGDDILIGNGGADTFVYSSGNDTISDYESRDRVSLTSAVESFDLDGDDVIIGFGSSSLTVADAANDSITFLETTDGKVTTNVNIFAADGIFNGKRTAVTLNADTSSYRANSSMLTIDGGLATGEIEIVGNAKANKIFAGDFGSTLNGGGGKDSLWGGDGSDTFIYSSGGGNDVIYNFGNDDALQIVGTFTASVVGEDVTFKVGSTANAITLKDYSATTFNVNGDTYRISGNNFVK